MIRRVWDKLNTSYWLSLGIVLAGTLIVYWYSLFHLLRSEILLYFLRAGSNNNLLSLIQNTMNSTTGASDNWLFRPLGTVIMAVNKVAFGFNHFAWHALALVLFMVVAWCLFRLLWRIRPGLLAMLMTLFFATFYATVNAVLYSQLISYLVFVALTLAGVFYLYRGVEVGKNVDIIVALICMFLSCFLYEMGAVLLILSGVYIWVMRRQSTLNINSSLIGVACTFAAFLLVYGSFKLFSPTSYQVAELGSIVSLQSFVTGAKYIVFILAYWIPMILVPSAFGIFPVASLEAQSASFGTVLPIMWIVLNLAAVAVIGYFAWPKHTKIVNKAFPLMLGLLAFLFVCLVAVYRGTDVHTGIMYVINTNITMNMFMAWTIPLAFWFIRPKTKHIKFVALGLMVMILISASKTFDLNYNVWKVEQPYREYLAYVESFVQEHKDEDGFSFTTINDGRRDYIEENLKFSWPEVSPDGEVNLVRSHYFEIKYYQYWDSQTPQYRIEYDAQERRFQAMGTEHLWRYWGFID